MVQEIFRKMFFGGILAIKSRTRYGNDPKPALFYAELTILLHKIFIDLVKNVVFILIFKKSTEEKKSE